MIAMMRTNAALGRRAGDGARQETADEVKFCRASVDVVDRKGVFEGYASVFNRQDLGRDVVLPGAFRRTLQARGIAGVRMLFQHDPNEPIGVWERIHEDARGLYVRGRLTVEVRKARDVLNLLRAGAAGIGSKHYRFAGSGQRLLHIKSAGPRRLQDTRCIVSRSTPGAARTKTTAKRHRKAVAACRGHRQLVVSAIGLSLGGQGR